jgi:hypothetical protein
MAYIKGADELRARLGALEQTFPVVAAGWQSDAVRLMQMRVHSPSGTLRRSISSRSAGFANLLSAKGYRTGRATLRAGVWADWRVTFQDKGTKDHGPTTKKVMTWGDKPDTIFARHVRGVRKRPFIRRSAREALKANPMAAAMIAQWNAAGGKGTITALGSKAAGRRRAAAMKARA